MIYKSSHNMILSKKAKNIIANFYIKSNYY